MTDLKTTSAPASSGPARPAPEISAVITCYYEEDTIDEFHRRLSATLESIGRPYEIIIVNRR